MLAHTALPGDERVDVRTPLCRSRGMDGVCPSCAISTSEPSSMALPAAQCTALMAMSDTSMVSTCREGCSRRTTRAMPHEPPDAADAAGLWMIDVYAPCVRMSNGKEA